MEKRDINLGGAYLNVKATGVDEALSKVNLLIEKINEAKSLIEQLASMSVNITFGENDSKLLND